MADRNKMIRAIKTAQRNLALDDGTYRETLWKLTGKTSASQLDERELGRVLSFLRQRGFCPVDDPFTRSQRGLIRRIWQSMGEHGALRNSSDASLDTYCRRIYHAALDELDPSGCSRIIEQLKKWVRRTDNDALIMDIDIMIR